MYLKKKTSCFNYSSRFWKLLFCIILFISLFVFCWGDLTLNFKQQNYNNNNNNNNDNNNIILKQQQQNNLFTFQQSSSNIIKESKTQIFEFLEPFLNYLSISNFENNNNNNDIDNNDIDNLNNFYSQNKNSESQSQSQSDSSNVECHHDKDCSTDMVCHKHCSNDMVCHHTCVHKSLGDYFSPWDLVTPLTLFIGSLLATPVGIGGGGLFVPTIALLGQFSTTRAVPLSTATITGSAISNYIIIWRRRHTVADRPLIDYRTAAAVLPSLLAGTTWGVLLNLMLPEIIVVIFIVVILGLTTIRTLMKGIQKFRRDRKLAKEETVSVNTSPSEEQIDVSDGFGGEHHEEEEEESETAPIINSSMSREQYHEPYQEQTSSSKHQNELEKNAIYDSGTDSEYNPFGARNTEDESGTTSKKLEKILQKESSSCPFDTWIVLGFGWVLLVVTSLLRGSTKTKSIAGIPLCSAGYWVMTVLSFLAMLSITVIMVFLLNRMHSKKVKLGYQFIDGDIKWTAKQGISTIMICTVAGVLAGMLGIGGGMFLSPLLLEFGVPADVTAASSAFMVLFTSSATAVQYFIAGTLMWDYGLLYAGVSFIAAIVGQFGITAILRRIRNSQFIVVMLIGGLIGVATVVMAADGINSIVSSSGGLFQFQVHQKICVAKY